MDIEYIAQTSNWQHPITFFFANDTLISKFMSILPEIFTATIVSTADHLFRSSPSGIWQVAVVPLDLSASQCVTKKHHSTEAYGRRDGLCNKSTPVVRRPIALALLCFIYIYITKCTSVWERGHMCVREHTGSICCAFLAFPIPKPTHCGWIYAITPR